MLLRTVLELGGNVKRSARIAKLQTLMQGQRIAALLAESGSTLQYFTDWHMTEQGPKLFTALARSIDDPTGA
jgi:hypothetical protein